MKFSEFLRKQPPKANLYMFVCEDDFLVDESQSVWARLLWRRMAFPETAAQGVRYHTDFGLDGVGAHASVVRTRPGLDSDRCRKTDQKRTTELEPLSAVEHSSLKIVFVLSSPPSRSRPPFPLIQIDRLRPEDMVRWLSGRFGVTLEVARYLVDNLVPELLPLKQEVEKLQTYVGGARQVEIADVDQLIFRSEQYGPFELDDAFLAKDYPKSVRVLGAMVEEGVEPILILSKLVRVWRQIFIAKAPEGRSSPAGGGGRRGSAALEGGTIVTACRTFDRGKIASGFEEFVRADQALKTSSPNPEYYFDVMLWKLIGTS